MATITITTTAPHDVRIAAAFGDLLGLTVPGTSTPRSATGPEIKAAILDRITNIVRDYERRQNQKALAEPVAITPT